MNPPARLPWLLRTLFARMLMRCCPQLVEQWIAPWLRAS
jgi:hypothetical protein